MPDGREEWAEEPSEENIISEHRQSRRRQVKKYYKINTEFPVVFRRFQIHDTALTNVGGSEYRVYDTALTNVIVSHCLHEAISLVITVPCILHLLIHFHRPGN